MKKYYLLIGIFLLSIPVLRAAQSEDPLIVNAEDIPANLKKTIKIKLTGLWNSSAFADLSMALGNAGFGGTNTVLTAVDMEDAEIAPDTKLISQGLIPSGTFVNCKALETVIMPVPEEAANFTDIQKAFMNCEKLAQIDLSGCSGLTHIGNTFYGCRSLVSVNIQHSEAIMSHSTSAFEGCERLKEVILPATIVFSGKIFAGCTALAKLDWTSWEGTEPPLFYYNMFDGISDLKKIHLVVKDTMYDLFVADENWQKLTVEKQSLSSLEWIRMPEKIVYPTPVYDISGKYKGILSQPDDFTRLSRGIYIIAGQNIYKSY